MLVSAPEVDTLNIERVGVLISEIHSCCNPSRGFMRFSGSQIRHREIKSRNNGSLHLRACPKVFEPGLRFLPLELTTSLGFPSGSNHSDECKGEKDISTIDFSPTQCLMHLNCKEHSPKNTFLRELFSTKYLPGTP